MNYYLINGELCNRDELEHHGVRGMKWGVRRYQNPDGSLTAAGKRRIRRQEQADYDESVTYDIKQAAKAGSNLKLARRELSSVEKKLEKASGEKADKLADRQKLLEQYIENQKMNNDFSVKVAERYASLGNPYWGVKLRDIPVETTKSGERFVIDRTGFLNSPYSGLVGTIGSGIQRVSEYKRSVNDYERVKKNGYNPNAPWEQLYKDYGVKYPR